MILSKTPVLNRKGIRKGVLSDSEVFFACLGLWANSLGIYITQSREMKLLYVWATWLMSVSSFGLYVPQKHWLWLAHCSMVPQDSTSCPASNRHLRNIPCVKAVKWFLRPGLMHSAPHTIQSISFLSPGTSDVIPSNKKCMTFLFPGSSHLTMRWRRWLPLLELEISGTLMLKEMATHSSVLAWRIPGTGEPGGLPSMGSHRVGHDWSDLAAAAAVVL